MAGKVLDRVLPLAKRIVRRRRSNPGAGLNGARVMAIDVFYPHHHGMTILACGIALFGNDDGAVACVQLGSMIGDSQPQAKAERIAKPVDGRADVRIPENGYYRARRHRPILKHSAHAMA